MRVWHIRGPCEQPRLAAPPASTEHAARLPPGIPGPRSRHQHSLGHDTRQCCTRASVAHAPVPHTGQCRLRPAGSDTSAAGTGRGAALAGSPASLHVRAAHQPVALAAADRRGCCERRRARQASLQAARPGIRVTGLPRLACDAPAAAAGRSAREALAEGNPLYASASARLEARYQARAVDVSLKAHRSGEKTGQQETLRGECLWRIHLKACTGGMHRTTRLMNGECLWRIHL